MIITKELWPELIVPYRKSRPNVVLNGAIKIESHWRWNSSTYFTILTDDWDGLMTWWNWIFKIIEWLQDGKLIIEDWRIRWDFYFKKQWSEIYLYPYYN